MGAEMTDQAKTVGMYTYWPLGSAPTCDTCPMLFIKGAKEDEPTEVWKFGSGLCTGNAGTEVRISRKRVACRLHPMMKAMVAILEEQARIDIVKMKIGVGDGQDT